MNVLPIVARELRVRATHKGFHWLRPVLATFAILSCLQWFSLNLAALTPVAIGQASFGMLVRLAFVVALGATILTADCVSSERRDGTLGLLFLTPLKSWDIMLGKFAATGLSAFYALLGFLPILMLPLLTGGISGGEVFRVSLSLLNLMFVSLAVGLFVSVFARGQLGAIMLSFVLFAFLLLLPFFINLMTSNLPFSFSAFSPFYAVNGAQQPWEDFWLSLGLCHLEGWLLIFSAAFALNRNWREIFQPRAARIPPPQVRGLVGTPRIVLTGAQLRKRAFAPVARAVLRLPGQQGVAWLAACISLVGSVAAAFALRTFTSIWAATSVTVVFGFASSALFAFVAGRFFFDARRSGELELLLVTPSGAKGILREQRFALVRMLRGPFYLAILGTIPVAVNSITLLNGREILGLILALCHVAGVASGIIAVCWAGMWFGSRVNHSWSIIGWTVGLVELLPTAFVYLIPAMLLSWSRTLVEFWVALVPALMLVKNIFFITFARQSLRSTFRADDGFSLARLFRTQPMDTARSEQPQTP